MLAALVLATLVAGGPAVLPPAPTAVRVVPDEPGAFVLPDLAPTYQAVAADLDGDGSREIVRLIAGERGSIVAEVWADAADRWRMLGSGLEVIPRRPGLGQRVVYAGAPVRLLVRQADGRDRVTLVRQPRFDEPGLAVECCLLLHDIVVVEGSPRLLVVADPGNSVGAISVIDLDGDGTDELLTSRSLPPLGDISFPSEAGVYRWNGEAFGPPTMTTLPVGSGDTPFVLGDSDGLPGEEAAIIITAGRPALFRVSLGEGDSLAVEDSGLSPTDATAVPIDDGRGLAMIGRSTGLVVLRWPAGREPETVADLPINGGSLLGVVQVLDEPRLVVHQADPEALHVLGLPNLSPPRGGSVTRSPAAATFAGSPLTPYVGPLPGGGPDGGAAVIYAGRLLPSDDLPGAPFRTLGAAVTGTLPGAQPVGLVGRDRGSLAILHAPLSLGRIDPAGGRLDRPVAQPFSTVSVAPLEVARAIERDDGALEPVLRATTVLPSGELAVSGAGFVAVVAGPPGSRIYLTDADPSVIGPVEVLPESGRVPVVIRPPVAGPSNHGYRASLSVATPAGHGYVATWDVRVLNMPPAIEAAVSTPFGSAQAEVSGRTVPYADVTVAGTSIVVQADGRFTTVVPLPPWPTDIEVVAADPVGNVTRTTLSGVGLLDYRGLPWPVISIALVVVIGAFLFMRVPGSRRGQPRAGDDAVLEELEPD